MSGHAHLLLSQVVFALHDDRLQICACAGFGGQREPATRLSRTTNKT